MKNQHNLTDNQDNVEDEKRMNEGGEINRKTEKDDEVILIPSFGTHLPVPGMKNNAKNPSNEGESLHVLQSLLVEKINSEDEINTSKPLLEKTLLFQAYQP
jgi:hypothetical protein